MHSPQRHRECRARIVFDWLVRDHPIKRSEPAGLIHGRRPGVLVESASAYSTRPIGFLCTTIEDRKSNATGVSAILTCVCDLFVVLALTSPFGIFFLPLGRQRGIEGDFPGSQIPPRPPLLKGGNSVGMCRCCITYIALYRATHVAPPTRLMGYLSKNTVQPVRSDPS